MPRRTRLPRSRLILAAVSVAALAAAATTASIAVADPVPTSPYQFSSTYDNGTTWRVTDNPQTHADTWQTTPGNSDTVAISPTNGQYADSGVIVPVGTVGDLFNEDGTFKGIAVTGPSITAVHVNIYADTNTDGQYLSFTYNGFNVDTAGDEIAYDVNNTQPTRDFFAAGDDSKVWAWVGVAGTTAQSAKIASVGGTSLFLPSKLTVANLCRLTRGSLQNLWLVSNVAGNRDRIFHLGVTYNGRTTWTGLHTVAAGKTLGVVSPTGGKAQIQYYDGSGAPHYATPTQTATWVSTKYCG